MRDIPGENTAENIQVVIDETTRLSELVSDLLDLSKIQSGTRKPVFEEFDLTAAVEEVMKRYDAFTAHQGYRITFEAETRATVFADHSMILQVLYNLIGNAVNYTGEDKRVFVTLRKTDENTFRFSVRDTGEGIKSEDFPNIWRRYYRSSEMHKRPVRGTGLGLSIVKTVLTKHNFYHGVESEEGKGSLFFVDFPLYKDEM